MNQVLVGAIEHKHRLRFLYDRSWRLVEPQCYGISRGGNELLRALQLEGGDIGEQLFTISKMIGLKLLNETFDRPGPNYKKNDSAMKTIFAQL